MDDREGIVLGLVPARGGSKGVKRKNVRSLVGRPLIAYAIEVGLSCPSIDRLVVSTDDGEIARIARVLGAEVPFMRPASLARDDTPMLPVLRHALECMERIHETIVSTVVLLDPTSPFRTVDDIDRALGLFYKDGGCHAVVSGCMARHSPEFNMVRLEEGRARLLMPTARHIGRRQDCPPSYDLDTTVWIYSREALMEIGERIPPDTRLYQVPEERSFHIDTEFDFMVAELLLNHNLTGEADVSHGWV